VSRNGTIPGYEADYVVGSVGSPLVRGKLPPGNGTSTSANIGGVPMTLGPLTTVGFVLPDIAATEIVFARSSGPPPCGRPLPPPAGTIIDDLHTE
jgi:hypothetical protein